jgi:hypothetical protein
LEYSQNAIATDLPKRHAVDFQQKQQLLKLSKQYSAPRSSSNGRQLPATLVAQLYLTEKANSYNSSSNLASFIVQRSQLYLTEKRSRLQQQQLCELIRTLRSISEKPSQLQQQQQQLCELIRARALSHRETQSICS